MRASPFVVVMITACSNHVNDTAPVGADEVLAEESPLSFEQRLAHTDVIKAVSASKGITNALLIAGVANHETNLVHCYEDAPWHCAGPFASTCGGAVLAGSGDGPCRIQEGGLGMFQLDSGTYSQTIAEHGRRVVEIDGNIDIGADFILYKVEICSMTPLFASRDEVIAWVNSAVPGTPMFETFMDAMASCYNGCSVAVCGRALHDQRMNQYRDAALRLLDEMGRDYWYPPALSCGEVASQLGYGYGGCEWNGNGACFGTGPSTWDCEHCCDLTRLPDPSTMTCGDFAASLGWESSLCEWNGNAACVAREGWATADCDVCCR
jgi:hypothetical protein